MQASSSSQYSTKTQFPSCRRGTMKSRYSSKKTPVTLLSAAILMALPMTPQAAVAQGTGSTAQAPRHRRRPHRPWRRHRRRKRRPQRHRRRRRMTYRPSATPKNRSNIAAQSLDTVTVTGLPRQPRKGAGHQARRERRGRCHRRRGHRQVPRPQPGRIAAAHPRRGRSPATPAKAATSRCAASARTSPACASTAWRR